MDLGLLLLSDGNAVEDASCLACKLTHSESCADPNAHGSNTSVVASALPSLCQIVIVSCRRTSKKKTFTTFRELKGLPSAFSLFSIGWLHAMIS
jgi:hypothetical protein